MIRKKGISELIFFFCLLMMTSCSTTALDSVWKDPHYQGGKLEKVLVIGVAKQQTNRRLFEDLFVAQLKTYGTDALASYTIIPSEEKLDKASVQSKIETLGVGAVLVTRLVDIKKERDFVPTSGYPTSYYKNDWYRGYTRSYGSIDVPGYYAQYEVVTLETNIYDTQTEKLIWSGLSDTVLEDSVKVAIESVIKAIIKKLSDDQLI